MMSDVIFYSALGFLRTLSMTDAGAMVFRVRYTRGMMEPSAMQEIFNAVDLEVGI